MTAAPRVLVVDDEETFLLATADLYANEGFECVTPADADAAIAYLDRSTFDLIVSDIKMPANPDLRLVRAVEATRRGTPVILVTGYPSLSTAVDAVDLAVSAYLIKPVDFQELLTRSRKAIEDYRALALVAEARSRAANWSEQLDRLEQALRERGRGASSEGVAAFVDCSVRNLVATTADLCAISTAMAGGAQAPHTCQILACPRNRGALSEIRAAIEVLEATKHAFKSKQLGDLRIRLEAYLRAESEPAA